MHLCIHTVCAFFRPWRQHLTTVYRKQNCDIYKVWRFYRINGTSYCGLEIGTAMSHIYRQDPARALSSLEDPQLKNHTVSYFCLSFYIFSIIKQGQQANERPALLVLADVSQSFEQEEEMSRRNFFDTLTLTTGLQSFRRRSFIMVVP